jgi:hypothetical protein
MSIHPRAAAFFEELEFNGKAVSFSDPLGQCPLPMFTGNIPPGTCPLKRTIPVLSESAQYCCYAEWPASLQPTSG